MINTKVHISNKDIKKQFDEIDESNLRDRVYYGIISDYDTFSEKSSLKVSLQVENPSIVVNDVGTVIYAIQIGYTEDNENKILIVDWEYGPTTEATAIQISDAINNSNTPLRSSYSDNVVTVYNVNDEGIIIEANEFINVELNSYVTIEPGSVIFKNGNSLTLNQSVTLPLVVGSNKHTLYKVIVEYSLIENEIGKDIFDENAIKSYSVKPFSESIRIDSDFDVDNKDTLCLGVIEATNKYATLLTSGVLDYNRPWFSSKDVYHRSQLGTSSVTERNPHGIGYNDIDSDNTLHNRLLDNGVIVSPSSSIQDCSGELVREELSPSSIKVDVDGKFYDENGAVVFYYELNYIPNNIHRIVGTVVYEEDHTTIREEREIYCKWFEGTNCIRVPDVTTEGNLIIEYTCTKTASLAVQYQQGIKINKIAGDDIVLSEGKNLKLYSSESNVFHKNTINNSYLIALDKEGNIATSPSVLFNDSISIGSNDVSNVYTRSRVQLYLYGTVCKSYVDCPMSGIKYFSTEQFSLYKTNISYNRLSTNDLKPVSESYTSPFDNEFNEVGDNSVHSDCIGIQLNDEANGINYDKYNYFEENLGYLAYNTIQGTYSKTFKINLNPKNRKLKRIEGYAICNSDSNINQLGASLSIDGSSISYDSRGGTGYISFYKDEINLDDVNYLDVTVNSSTKVYVSKMEFKFYYDEVYTTYYITQKEGDEDVTRRLYDPTFQSYGTDVIFDSNFPNVVFIKKSAIIYDESTPIDNNKFPKSTVYDNADFKVGVSIYGEANGEMITETVEFDSKFREQEGLNYKISSNAFESISKYSVNYSSTTGTIIGFAQQLSNYRNFCNLNRVNVYSDKIKNIYDERLCCSTIDNSIDNPNITESLFSYCDANI